MHGTFYWRSVYGDLMASSLFGRAIFAHAPRTGRMAQSLLLFLLLLWLLTSNYSTCTTAADIDVGFFSPSISWSGLSLSCLPVGLSVHIVACFFGWMFPCFCRKEGEIKKPLTLLLFIIKRSRSARPLEAFHPSSLAHRLNWIDLECTDEPWQPTWAVRRVVMELNVEMRKKINTNISFAMCVWVQVGHLFPKRPTLLYLWPSFQVWRVLEKQVPTPCRTTSSPCE